MNTSSLVFIVEQYAPAISFDGVREADRPQYALCAHLWELMVEQYAGCHLASDLHAAINHAGLYACIESADKVALSTLRGEWFDTSGLPQLWFRIVSAALSSEGSTFYESFLKSYTQGYEDIPGILLAEDCFYSGEVNDLIDCIKKGVMPMNDFVQECLIAEVVLRFPKRFTSVKPDTRPAMDKFAQVCREVRQFSDDWKSRPGTALLEHVKANMRRIFGLDTKSGLRFFHKLAKDFELESGAFSTGSCYYPELSKDLGGEYGCTSKCPAAKYGYLSVVGNNTLYHEYLLDPLATSTSGEPDSRQFKRRTVFRSPQERERYNAAYDEYVRQWHCKYDAYMLPVPKDYETSRMIAPETPLLNWRATAVRKLLLALARQSGAIEYMDPEDQSVNRWLAHLGSITEEWDTTDLSHASDSIQRDLFFEVIPEELRSIIRWALSDYIVINGQRWRTPMLATSGSVLTPICESAFFLSLCWTACDLAKAGQKQPRMHSEAYVYNDDIVTRNEITQTVHEVLASFHLTVNDRKSFVGSNPFRESCGGEYCMGYDVTGKYWPRKALKFTLNKNVLKPCTEAVQTLISMQHRLFYFSYVRQAIERIIIDAYPDMTFSPVGTDCVDLWAEWMDDTKSLSSPHYQAHVEWNRVPIQIGTGLHELAIHGEQMMRYQAYIDFLKNGPQYSDPLSELLHVSTPRDSYRHALEVPSTTIVRRKPVVRPTW